MRENTILDESNLNHINIDGKVSGYIKTIEITNLYNDIKLNFTDDIKKAKTGIFYFYINSTTSTKNIAKIMEYIESISNNMEIIFTTHIDDNIDNMRIQYKCILFGI